VSDAALPETTKAAIERLVRIAQSDTGQSCRVANFLLAWWNAEACGGFDLTDLWGVDAAIAADMVMVFAILASITRTCLVTGCSSRPSCAPGGHHASRRKRYDHRYGAASAARERS